MIVEILPIGAGELLVYLDATLAGRLGLCLKSLHVVVVGVQHCVAIYHLGG